MLFPPSFAPPSSQMRWEGLTWEEGVRCSPGKNKRLSRKKGRQNRKVNRLHSRKSSKNSSFRPFDTSSKVRKITLIRLNWTKKKSSNKIATPLTILPSPSWAATVKLWFYLGLCSDVAALKEHALMKSTSFRMMKNSICRISEKSTRAKETTRPERRLLHRAVLGQKLLNASLSPAWLPHEQSWLTLISRRSCFKCRLRMSGRRSRFRRTVILPPRKTRSQRFQRWAVSCASHLKNQPLFQHSARVTWASQSYGNSK